MAKNTTQPGALQALKNSIKEKVFRRLYFFHGEESFLLHYYLEQMKRILVDELTESFNYHKLTAETFDLQTFADAVENLPMMADSTFVWVDEVDIFKLSETEREKLAEVLSDIPDYCTVVFSYETTQWKPDKRLKKLWDAVESCGTEVAFEKQEPRDLIAWVTRHFAAEGKRITPDLCSYLIDITGGTMTALAGEISKICAYSDADQIVKSDIDAVTEPVLDAVIYQMTDFLGKGEYGPALLKMRQLLKMQQEPLSILGAIGAHFRRLGAARTLLDHGRSYNDLMRLCDMKEYPAKKIMTAAGRFSAAFCEQAQSLILQTDYQIKTSFDDPERLLEILILRLAQEARRG